MKGKWKKVCQRALSMLLCVSLLMPVGQEVTAASVKDSEEKIKVLDSSRIAEDKLPEGDYIYFGTASAQVQEQGVYALRLYRAGGMEKEASVTVNSIDMTAVYGEDYEILMEGVEETGDGKTILEKQFRGKEFVEEKTLSDTSARNSAGKELSGGAQTASDGAKHQGLTDALMDVLVEDSMECLDTSSSCTVRFAPGEDEKIFKFKILSDDKSEGTEGFSLLLTNPQGAKTYEVTSASIMIEDDEEEVRSQVSFTESSYQSGDGTAVLTVARQGAEYSVCDMTLYTSGDTAKSGENYGERYETLTFFPYETEKQIEIPVKGEGKFDVCLSDLKACSEGEHMKAEVTIAESTDNRVVSGNKETDRAEASKAAQGTDNVLRSSTDKDVQSFGISIRSDAEGAAPEDNKKYSVEYRMGEKPAGLWTLPSTPP